MKFKFSYETLLKFRKSLEDTAQREYLEAQQNVNESMKVIEKMYKEIDLTREKMFQMQQAGGPQAPQLSFMDEFITGHKIRIDRERQKARVLLQIAEEKQEVLIEKAKEHKIIKALKEKRWFNFKKEMKKIELKQIDDIVTMRFKKGDKL